MPFPHWQAMNAEQDIQQVKRRIAEVYARREFLQRERETGAVAPRAGFTQLEESDREPSGLDTRF